MDQTLRQILEKITEAKESYSITLSNNTTDFHTAFNPTLSLSESKEYEVALIGLETYNSIPNVQEDTLVYSSDDGGSYSELVIPTGSYEIEALNDYINRQLSYKDLDDKIKITANNSTLRCEIVINEGFMVDMTASTISRVFGFTELGQIGKGEHIGSRAVDIMPVSTILVNCDLVAGSFVNGSSRPTIYSFFPDVSPGFKVIEKPVHPVYLPLNYYTISSIHLWLTDQNDNKLNLRGENVSLRLHIRSK
jgi:hypothetical protein